MAKRKNLPQPALGGGTTRTGSGRKPRDPLTRLLMFCQLMALGMVAAAVYLRYPNELAAPPGQPEITADLFSTGLDKAAFVAVHTRLAWITLSLLSLIAAVIAFQNRNKPKRNVLIRCAPLAVLVVIALHATGQAIRQSHGSLSFEFHGKAPAGMDSIPLTIPGPDSQPIQIAMETSTITRYTVPEGTAAQWELLLGGDLLFAVPLLFAWILSFAAVTRASRPPA